MISSDKWVVTSVPRPEAKLRLLCLPHAGGGPQVFNGWADELPAEVEVAGIQLPGRWMRWKEPAFKRMEPLVTAARTALEPHFDRPFAFFGHSLGALIAFELTRELKKEGAEGPRCLVVSGRAPPDVDLGLQKVHQLDDDGLVEAMTGTYEGIPPEVAADQDLLDVVLPAIRADMEVVETYRYEPGPPTECPIHGYFGENDPVAPPGRMAPWGDHTTSSFSLDVFPGGHFFISTAKTQVLRTLRRQLQQILTGAGD